MKIFFFCYPLGTPDKAGYEHQIVSIAEGLRLHNVDFYGNVNYWQEDSGENSFLIKENPDVDYKDCDVVVLSSVLFDYKRLDLLPQNLFSSKRNYKLIFIDSADGLVTPGLEPQVRSADYVLKSHYCKKADYPANFIPWQFGLTNRIIQSINAIPFQDREDEICVNYRVRHTLRNLAEKRVMGLFYENFTPNSQVDSFKENNFEDENSLLFWKQTGRRHYPSYYARLGRSKLSSAFGGSLKNPLTVKRGRVWELLGKAERFLNTTIREYDRVYQFDSWRFWESLASGCCTLHVDFARYSAALPVMPTSGEHYIGVDFADLGKVKDILRDEKNLEYIANNGRNWALENYSPKKIAERFLTLAV